MKTRKVLKQTKQTKNFSKTNLEVSKMLKKIISEVKASNLIKMVSEKISEVVESKQPEQKEVQIEECVIVDVQTNLTHANVLKVYNVLKFNKSFSQLKQLPCIKIKSKEYKYSERVIMFIEALKDYYYDYHYRIPEYIQMHPKTYYNIISVLKKISDYGNYENSDTFTTEHNRPTICGLEIEYVDCYEENKVTISDKTLKFALGWV